jgi:hypothetical protein
MSGYVATVINDKAYALLERIIATGAYGETESEVVAHLILRGVQDALAGGIISLPDPEFGEVEPAPAPPPLDGKPPCATCDSGLSFPPDDKVVNGGKPDEACADCGRETAIPF